MIFEDNKDLEISEFYIKEVDIPDISLDSSEITRAPYAIKNPSNIYTYSDLSMTFFVDANLIVYKQLYNLLFDWNVDEETSDATFIKRNLTIQKLDNLMKKSVVDFKFENAFLSSLSNLSLNNYDNQPLFCTVTFKYNKFTPMFNI